MTVPTRTLAEWQQIAREQPEKYSVKNGVVNDLQAKGGARIITSFNQAKLTPFTPERSRELHARRKALSLKSRIKGRIDAVRKFAQENKLEIELPDPNQITDEELLVANGNAERLIQSLFTLAFMKAAKDAKNFRGLGEGFPKVMFLEDQQERAREDIPPPGTLSLAPETLLILADLIERERSAAVDRARAIDADLPTAGRSGGQE